MQRFYSLFLLLAVCLTVNAQQKKDLTPADYAKWQFFAGTTLSENGEWAAYSVGVQEDNDTLYLFNQLTNKRYALEFSTAPSFSKDNQWVAYNIGVPFKEAEKLRDQKMPIPLKMGLLNLVTGKKEVIKDISSFRFSRNGKFLAVTLNPPKENKDKGTVVLLRNLADSSTRTIGNVTASEFNRKSDHFAYILESANQAGNTVELFNLQTNVVKVLASDTCKFSKLAWSKEGDGLAFYKTTKSEDYEEENAQVYVYKNSVLSVFDPAKQPAFPKGMRINPNSNLRLTDDVTAVYFSIKNWTAKPAKKSPVKDSASVKKDTVSIAKADTTKKTIVPPAPKKEDKLAAVDIWHWKDTEIQPRQKITYMMDKDFSLQSVWNFSSNSFFQLASDSTPRANLANYQKFAVITTDKKYKPAFKEDFSDFYLVNTRTGEKKLIGEKIILSYGYAPNLSPDSKYALYYKDKQWFTYNTTTGENVNITKDIPTIFEDFHDDHPAAKPPFGLGGWTKGDKEILLYDEYDVYAVKPDGKGFRKLTDGTKEEIRHRIIRTDFEEPFLDDSKAIYIDLYGDKSKYFGVGKVEKGKFSRLIYEPNAVDQFNKAKEADVFTFIRADYNRSPELYITKNFQGEQKMASTNPQQKDYKWGKSELISFTNKKGKKMQGALFYPADYQPGKQYPMVVYIYEELANTVHSYVIPSERRAYNTTNYTSGGYFIFRPDIVYDINDPGMSAVDCVVPAVEEVLKTGMIDKNKVGLMGHSWGAYQTSFIITQTDLFKAACAGAPLTNLISMSLAIYWNSGMPDQKIFETSQGRFDGPWYDRMQEHMRNSPIYAAQNIKAPLLVAFGDKDGAVDWHQGIEMYGTMRRMEKPHVMLVYADENHGLAKKENQIDYQKRQREWFDHYLLGKTAPKWITEGVSYLDKMKEQEKESKQ
ncbi:prolyl oligopeptidase family serine peptidase [Chitinophaga sp. SYP-B3965]|uniref:alpha/beta hydrolase family protein n=1 Tax=Chitinophaga sp. SYP-B3965 TaxID=2663120 RepID=UPI0012997C92|nr:prolyl oligopeptidase family serine peptidase [Chitinophaga sp. SYP-B3965]MRG45928.1 prolyl oligopeptidase family serine peptidase [Chitinophaga sp. SYP-B3965]